MTETGTTGPDSKKPAAPPAGAPAAQPPAAVAGEAPKPSPGARLKAKLGLLGAAIKGGLGEVAEFFGNFRERIKGVGHAIVSIPSLLVRGDLTTRILTVGFLASIALLVVTGDQILKKLAGYFERPKVVHTDSAREAAEKRLALMASNVVFLERFTGVLETTPGQPASFEIELYVEVDAPESASVLRAHLSQGREMVSGAIQGHKFSELSTDQGKEALKEDIRAAVSRLLQRWTKKGSVKNVFFTHFVMA